MLQKLIQLLAGGTAATVSGMVINGISIAALAPAALWFVSNKDDVLIVVTYGEAAVFGLLIFAFIKIAHYTKAPGQ